MSDSYCNGKAQWKASELECRKPFDSQGAKSVARMMEARSARMGFGAKEEVKGKWGVVSSHKAYMVYYWD